MINYGNWQETEKLQGSNAWQNPHQNAFGGMLRALDPMTYAPGPIGASSNAIHDAGDSAVTGANTLLSPVVKGTNKFLKMTSPGVQYAEDRIPMMGGINRFVEDKPFDAAALAAATFFSGGAASSALGGIGAPAASGGAGAMGGMASSGAAGTAAITPAFASGAVGTGVGAGAAGSTTGSLIGASAITPALASGTYGGIAGAAGTGTLGTAGTAAATSALTPSFAAMGGAGVGGFMNSSKSLFDKAKTVNSYKNSFSNFGQPDTARQTASDRANRLSQALISSNNAPDINTKRIANQIYMNKWWAR